MPARLKFIVAYDGTPFCGWQSQANGNSVQDHLERAFKAICETPVRVHGSGRTDAGVHALAQCAHVDLPDRRFSGARWIPAVNAGLPPTIRVLRCGYVTEAFHARFSAKGKIYRYRICNAAVLPPLEFGRAWHVVKPLDRKIFSEAAELFAGEHDFAGFAANGGNDVESTVRALRSVRVRRSGPAIRVEFDGTGFLYKMVRLMIGAIVEAATGRSTVNEIRARLAITNTPINCARLVAPASGLILLRIRY